MAFKYLLIILLSINFSFAQNIPSVTTGSVIEADKINSIISKQNSIVRSIVKTYKSGHDWYEINNDGWVRQGGYISNSTSSMKTVSFLIKMKDTFYDASRDFISSPYTGSFAPYHISVHNLTVNSIQIYTDGNIANAKWRIEGYADSSALASLGVIVSY